MGKGLDKYFPDTNLNISINAPLVVVNEKQNQSRERAKGFRLGNEKAGRNEA